MQTSSTDGNTHSRLLKGITILNPPPDQDTMDRYLNSLNNPHSPSANLYQDLEMTGRFVNTHEDISYEKDTVQLHSHSFMELLCCRTGSIQYLIGIDRYNILPGDIICIPPGVSHRPLLPDRMEVPYMRTVLWLSQEFLNRIEDVWPETHSFREKSGVIHTAGTAYAHLPDLFHAGYQESVKNASEWQIWVCGNTLQIITELTRAFEAQKNMPAELAHRELLDDIIGYIEEHLADKISLEGTARQLYVSQSAIRQTFEKNLDISFYRYVTLRRLIAAKNLIREGYPLSEVPAKVGYTDYSTFYRAFRKEYGVSPSELRDLPISAE